MHSLSTNTPPLSIHDSSLFCDVKPADLLSATSCSRHIGHFPVSAGNQRLFTRGEKLQNILSLLVAVVIVIQPIQGWSMTVGQILGILGTMLSSGLQRPPEPAKLKEESIKVSEPQEERGAAVVLKDETTTEPKAEDK